jgi:hypothetical protein
VRTAGDVLDLPLVRISNAKSSWSRTTRLTQIPPGSAKPFEAGGDIDAVAIDVAAILDDASSLILCGTDAPLLRDGRVVHCHLALDGAAHLVHDAGEPDEQTRRPRSLTIRPGNRAPQPLFPRPSG